MPKESHLIQIKKAHKNDIAVLVEWYLSNHRNIIYPKDRESKRSSLKGYFKNLINSETDILLIGLIDIIRFGVALCKEVKDGEYKVFLSIKTSYSMRGLYPEFLKEVISELKENQVVNKITFEIPDINQASRLIIEKEGFQLNKLDKNTLIWEEVTSV